MSGVTGIYLLDASLVPELRAKYFTFPGHETKDSPVRDRCIILPKIKTTG